MATLMRSAQLQQIPEKVPRAGRDTIRRMCVLALCVGVASNCRSSDNPVAQDEAEQGTIANAGEPIDVSVIELIARPQEFAGRLVRVVGFAVLEFEGTVLYLHEEDHRRALVKNGIWLNIDRSKFSSWQPSYAVVEGNFSSENHGHMGLFSGALTDVQRLSAWHAP